jgi:ABC-2 type transport system permease protein
MKIHGLKPYLLLDLRLAFRERVSLLLMLALPAFMYVFFGLMFGQARYGARAVTYFDEYTPSFTGLILLNVALMNVGPAIVIYKELGFFRRLLVTPLDMAAVWVAAITRATLIYMIGYFEMLLIGWAMFGRFPSASLLQSVLSLLLCCFGMFSFGVLLGSLFKASATAFSAGIFIFQPMLLLSGASIPLDQFPRWVTSLAQLLPMTHVVTILRLAWSNRFLSVEAIGPTLYLLAFGAICALVSRRVFRWSTV